MLSNEFRWDKLLDVRANIRNGEPVLVRTPPNIELVVRCLLLVVTAVLSAWCVALGGVSPFVEAAALQKKTQQQVLQSSLKVTMWP